MVVSAAAHFKEANAAVDMLDVSVDRTMETVNNTVAQTAPAIEISPLTSLMDTLGGGQSQSPEASTDSQSQLRQQFTAALAAAPTMKPTAHLSNAAPASNTVANRQEGQAKTVDANQKVAELKSEVQDITRKMGAGQNGNDAAAGQGPAQPSMMGALAGGLARDAVITGGLTAMGMPFAAAAAGAASLAVAVTGRGTFGVANSGEFGRDKVTRSGRVLESGYSRNEPSPSDAQSGPAAPQTAALWNKLSQGPGFGSDPRRSVDAGTAELAGNTLTGITALKIAENSPAMMAYKSQRLDGETVGNIHQARIAKGIVADEQNVTQAQNIGIALPDNRQTLPGMHV
ncbi:MAG: hypothetical protein ACXW4B_08745 [Micavibrio sp.]